MIKIIKTTIAIIFFFFLLSVLTKNIWDYKNKISFYQQYQKDYQEELIRNKELKSEVLKSQDRYFLEKEIRKKLNLIRPNEITVIIPKKELIITPTLSVTKPIKSRWLELFFDK